MVASLKSLLLKKIHKSAYPPGHYYSPIPDLNEVAKDEERIFKVSKDIAGINLNSEGQKQYLTKVKTFINERNFSQHKTDAERYYTTNGFFVESDALYYQAIIKDFRPKRVIEVGSGFSSAVLFDTLSQTGFNGVSIDLIEPFPDRLFNLFTSEDRSRYTLHKQRVQTVPVSLFETLKPGDILFIDSSHISKVGSDFNFLLFQILPILQPGVLVHLHDILFPFEYPKEWIYEGRFWNEAYLLKAFLMYNSGFNILLFNDYFVKTENIYLSEIDQRLQAGGGSIWLQKLQ